MPRSINCAVTGSGLFSTKFVVPVNFPVNTDASSCGKYSRPLMTTPGACGIVPGTASCELTPLAKKPFGDCGRSLSWRFMSAKIWIGVLRVCVPCRPAMPTTASTATKKIRRK